MEITYRYRNICVNDEEITYIIDRSGTHYVEYNNNILHIPFVINFMKTCNNNVIVDNHEDIKRCLFNLDDLINNLPNLVLCKLPTWSDFDNEGEILLDNDDELYYGINRISFWPVDGNYSLDIDYHNITLTKIAEDEGDNIFNINNKIVVINTTFDPESFAESIRTYVGQHLVLLLNLFKANTKSARNKI